MFPLSKGGTVVMITLNSLPGVTVSNSAVKDLLLLSGAERVSFSSVLLTILTSVFTGCNDSAGTLTAANCGLTSIGFHTVPLICSIRLGCALSLQETVMVFI